MQYMVWGENFEATDKQKEGEKSNITYNSTIQR